MDVYYNICGFFGYVLVFGYEWWKLECRYWFVIVDFDKEEDECWYKGDVCNGVYKF